MTSILENLQMAVVRQLREQSTLASATIMARRTVDLDSQIEAATQASLGMSIIVLDPCPSRVELSLPGPVFQEITITLRLVENLLIKPNGPGLLAAAEQTSHALHLWPLPTPWADSVLRLAERNPWTTLANPVRGTVTLDLHFIAAGPVAVGCP